MEKNICILLHVYVHLIEVGFLHIKFYQKCGILFRHKFTIFQQYLMITLCTNYYKIQDTRYKTLFKLGMVI